MRAKAIWRSRNTPGLKGAILRAAFWFYQTVRPPAPDRVRGINNEIYKKYFHREGEALFIGSNFPAKPVHATGITSFKQLDIARHEHVDIVADAETMSSVVGEASFDYVVSTSMLEHTLHPWKVVEESAKVLKPGGYLFLSVPWMYPFHGEPHDYYRFSMPCLKNLVKEAGLEEVESGSNISGHGALYQFLLTYLCEVFSFNNSVLFFTLRWLFAWLLFPLRLLELMFKLGPRETYYTDALIYIVARKPETK